MVKEVRLIRYRYNEHDDWGVIRSGVDNIPLLKINPYFFTDDFDKHRSNNTDPCQEFGRALAKIWNTRELEAVDGKVLLKKYVEQPRNMALFSISSSSSLPIRSPMSNELCARQAMSAALAMKGNWRKKDGEKDTEHVKRVYKTIRKAIRMTDEISDRSFEVTHG